MSFDEDTSLLAAEAKLAQNAKKIALMVLGTAAQKYMMGLADQQEVLVNCADIIMDAYQMETAVLRAKKIAGATETPAEIAAWTTTARILLNTDEFITRD